MLGLVHNVNDDYANTGIAGGLWIAPGFVSGTTTIGALSQGTPDMYVMYELRLGGGGTEYNLTYGDPICGIWQGPDTCVEDFEDQDIAPWTCVAGEKVDNTG
jgi:hypothetical protein